MCGGEGEGTHRRHTLYSVVGSCEGEGERMRGAMGGGRGDESRNGGGRGDGEMEIWERGDGKGQCNQRRLRRLSSLVVILFRCDMTWCLEVWHSMM
jgi:hypothetical protein